MQQSNRAGLLFAMAGFGVLSLGDAIIKGMTDLWPPTALAMTRYVLAAIVLSAILAAKEGPRALIQMPKAGLQWLRGLSVSLATIAMFTAVWLMPLAEATTITFMQPLITAVLAMIFLGEKLRFSTVCAIFIAFVGVMIVLRPNLAELGWLAFVPLIAAFAMAMLMVANRASAGSASVLAMQVYIANCASILLVLATIGLHFSGIEHFEMHWPEWHVVARCAFVACSATLAHLLIYMGAVRAGAATIAPMTYVQLLSAVSLGYFFFGEVPDLVAMLGALVIIGAGLWFWFLNREAKQAKPPN